MSHQPLSRPESRPQLLIVDDDPAVLDVARSMARTLGCHALVADNAEQAIEAFRENADDIYAVIVDLNMPRLGGLELIQLIRAHRRDACVLLMTGDHVDEACLAAAGITAEFLLTKPFALDELRAALFGSADEAKAA